MTQYEALKRAGWVQTIDFVIGFGFIAGWVTLGFWALFAPDPNLKVMAAAIVGLMMLSQLWLVILAFRLSHFILLARADINLMPNEAARLAVRLQQSGGLPNQ